MMFVDTFSAGLDDLTRKQARDEVTVMRALSKMTRYSIFEVTANDTIARMMTDIVQRGLIKITGGQYPWTTFEITDAGRAILDSLPAGADTSKESK